MKSIKYIILILSILCLVLGDDPKIDVIINDGSTSATIQGYAHSYGKSWRGIPYAVPPIGSLRFTYAQSQDPHGNMSALSYGPSCAQPGKGKEDCLYLNIFAPTNSSLNGKLPVYVYIHGGGFTEGSGDLGSGIYQTLVNKGLILVSINYRLGPFGFFSTREAMAAGNWAVSDWIEALNWVQRWISYFGGDPRQVTIGGQSSGAEAVSLLSMTEKSKNLYKQLIMQSGSAFTSAVMSYSDYTRNTSAELAISSGCATEESWDSEMDYGIIVRCLRGLTQAQVISEDSKLRNHRMKWSVVADKKYFVRRLESLALRRSSTPVLIGNVHDEWLAWELNNIMKNLNSSANTQEGLRNILKNSYEMTYWDNPKSVYAAAANKYINYPVIAADDNVGWMAQHIKLFSEMIFIGPVLRDAKYFDYTRSKVYLYSFDYLSPRALSQITQPQLRGVPHSWDLLYLMSTECYWTCDADDEKLRTITSDIWANFIKTGNPSPSGSSLPFSFPRIGNSNSYVSLKPNPTSSLDYHTDSMFWACTAPTIDGYTPPFC